MTLPLELIARWKPGENLPVYADPAAIEAGRFVRITGKNSRGAYKGRHAVTGERPTGVAERKVPAVPAAPAQPTNRNATNINRRGAVARVVAGAAIAVGAKVGPDATGRAIVTAGADMAGEALTAAATAGDVIEVDLY